MRTRKTRPVKKGEQSRFSKVLRRGSRRRCMVGTNYLYVFLNRSITLFCFEISTQNVTSLTCPKLRYNKFSFSMRSNHFGTIVFV